MESSNDPFASLPPRPPRIMPPRVSSPSGGPSVSRPESPAPPDGPSGWDLPPPPPAAPWNGAANGTSPAAGVTPERAGDSGDWAHASGLTRRERRMRRGFIARKLGFNDHWANAFDWIFFAGFTVLAVFVLRTFVVGSFFIPSESMVPTLQKGDRILVNKLSTHPDRGDVVVFRAVRAGPDKDLVKRVIGLPGDTIEGRDGKVFVNGKALDEPWLPKGVTTDNFGPTIKTPSGADLEDSSGTPVTKVPPNSYFMMGDNRPASQDSRYWGVVPQSNIIGDAVVRYWPFGRIGFL